MFKSLTIALVTVVLSSLTSHALAQAAMKPDLSKNLPQGQSNSSAASDGAEHGHASGHARRTEPNRLGQETSPYLLQHAYNPVDWYPWGEEAFEQARLENKPIFLSVGYSTCYWCHVMERESFENPEVAAFMNEHFINIKVDREERPDVDDVYMAAVQLMTRRGGWPMSVFLEPTQLKPFFGGTYFPPEDQNGRPGFVSLGTRLSEAWTTQEALVREQANRVADSVIAQMGERPTAVPIGRDQVDASVSQLMGRYDKTDAGYGGAPKFPMPVTLDLLMEAGWEIPRVRASILHTLDRMAMGGMYDQVGGGFHRYSTDGKWLVPHFEKMLYDNGMLASVYARACQETGDGYYCVIAREILDYTLRSMTHEGGAFYSAQDAESNAREGESYLWDESEVRAVLAAGDLDAADIDFIVTAYGLDRGTNFRDPHHLGEPARNVLYLPDRPEETAALSGLSGEELHEKFVEANAILLAHRDQRDQPITDDKIIVGWNGLMIGGMADTGRLLDEPEYTEAAIRAAIWIREHMWSSQDGLLRTARGDDAKIAAFLEDYALFIRGLLSLYEATDDEQWLVLAETLAVQARARFWDENTGGWFDTQPDQPDLFVRGRSLYDGALPSGSGSMLMDLVRLKAARGDTRWDDDIREALASASASVARSPTSTATTTQALSRLLRDHPEVLARKATNNAVVVGHVTMKMVPGRVAIGKGQPARSTIVLTVAPGWHLTSPEQEDEFAIPMSITALDPNLAVTPTWPAAHPFEGPTGSVNVYDGTIRIPIELNATGPVEAQARIMLTWQACNDRVCDRPQTIRIPLTIEMADGQ